MKIQSLLAQCAVLCCVVLGLHSASAQVQNESRLALLIGNASYRSSPLNNPVNDVRLMERALQDAGFTVLKAENATRRDMQRLVRDFGEKLKQSGGVGLFYFAGHGVQVKGANYLVPVDADIRAEDEVAFDSIDAQSVLEKMETAKNRINLLILDACRDNPFAKGSRSGSAGLATMSAPSGSLVAYSTAPGSVASDGTGNNGLYTQHLAAAIRVPDMPIEEVFKRVRASVRKDSANQQTPWENTALEGNFYFKKSPPVVVTAVAPTPTPQTIQVAPTASVAPNMMAVELAYWESIKTSNRPFELEAYIEQFPNGAFVGLAKARLREVAREQRAAANQPPPALIAIATPSPSSATVAPQTVAASLPVQQIAEGQKLGTLVIHDRIFNSKTELKLSVTEKTASYTTYSSGDKIASNGEVLAVRFADRVLTLSSGQLWKFPLRVGDKGQAETNDGRGNRVIQWQIKAGTKAGDVVVHAEYTTYQSMPAGSRSGTWSGDYSGHHVPTATSFSMRTGGPGTRPDLVTTSITP